MRQSQAIAIYAGGVGSGCHGPSCGRKPSGRQLSDKAQRALATYKPSTKAKQKVAEQSEVAVARAVKGTMLPDHEPFDVLVPGKHAIEVKTLIDNDNDKITMHPGSRRRKEEEAEQKGLKMHTVVLDKRVPGKVTVYYKQGVGAFRLGGMTQLGSMTDLVSMLKKRA